ncbi:unnamed protein product [Rotaria magnacalcarata]|uniref:F-box domain-containing protein n=1 Tax=Rotaria magnacalcarata TaxID=392030 RepID=A0A814FLC2_9BILA|nr:unnamed protein product [Rotaria magnacalcarata]CAF4039969.1 unnamed protein product [Rotaria magnacalcarata]
MSTCLFDLFPVELVHHIFHYLWAHEIFYGFTQLSSHLDNVLVGYDRYSISLSSMLKREFDLMCLHIRPEQVISITLAENSDTPDQSEIFFSKFDILQFINLRSFSIISLNQSIFRQLNLLCQLNQFQSLTLPHISDTYWRLFGSSVEKTLPRLKQLITRDYPLMEPLHNMKYLTITYSYCHNLEYLLRLMTNLYSLNITLSLNVSSRWSQKAPIMNHLRQLTLCVEYGRLTMSKMNQFLLKMPCLKNFELRIDDPIDFNVDDQWEVWSRNLKDDIEDTKDIIDGNQWKYLVSHLQTFNFRFCLAERLDKQILDSFRSSFWLEQKKWFVSYDDLESSPSLFTVPRFTPKDITYLLNYHTPSCTSSDLKLDQYVHILNLPMLCPLMQDFINVTTLILQTDKDLSLDRILPYLSLPQLRSLSLVSTSLLTQLPTEIKFESIRSLTIDTLEIKSHAEQICIVFPRIERLQIEINDQETMSLLIDRLKRLSLATFVCHHSSILTNMTKEWFVENSSRLKENNNFTCRIDKGKIHLWISVH